MPDIRVKNTFLEVPATPLLEGQRALKTCPSAHVGRLLGEASLAEPLPLAPPAPPPRRALCLAEALGDEQGWASGPPLGLAPGTVELPSVGSSGHAFGDCRPCAFFHSGRCEKGPGCVFCHLCGPEERKRRKQRKLELRRAARTRQG